VRGGEVLASTTVVTHDTVARGRQQDEHVVHDFGTSTQRSVGLDVQLGGLADRFACIELPYGSVSATTYGVASGSQILV
jgi:hypothetical protein